MAVNWSARALTGALTIVFMTQPGFALASWLEHGAQKSSAVPAYPVNSTYPLPVTRCPRDVPAALTAPSQYAIPPVVRVMSSWSATRGSRTRSMPSLAIRRRQRAG